MGTWYRTKLCQKVIRGIQVKKPPLIKNPGQIRGGVLKKPKYRSGTQKKVRPKTWFLDVSECYKNFKNHQWWHCPSDRASLVFCRYSYVITHLNSADRVSEVSTQYFYSETHNRWVGSSPQAKFFGDFEPPKRDFPYKNSVFDEVFKGKNNKIGTKKLSFLRNPPLIKNPGQIRGGFLKSSIWDPKKFGQKRDFWAFQSKFRQQIFSAFGRTILLRNKGDSC